MRVNNVIPVCWLLELARSNGYMYQMSLPLTPPEYTLPVEYFSDIPIGYSWIEEYTGTTCSDIQHVDHPGFTRLRNHLEARGYIKTERNSCNGDVVLNVFRLNGKWFEKGDRFPCAVAIKIEFALKDHNERLSYEERNK